MLNKMKTKQSDRHIRSCTNPSVSFSPLWILNIAAALLDFSHEWERNKLKSKELLPMQECFEGPVSFLCYFCSVREFAAAASSHDGPLLFGCWETGYALVAGHPMGQKFHLWNFRNPSAGIVCVYCSVFPSHDFITTLGMFISAVVFSFITIPSFCYFVEIWQFQCLLGLFSRLLVVDAATMHTAISVRVFIVFSHSI